ncbi:TonB-dependent receptor [Pseudoduganella sp. FT55W]|uniref:TonB-dependent receptor n=1 Tax=Duganella rivi TaxID=2666083 RepID=A0A7X4GT26_9BURK|nr:TonB-dependent receptor [Duganella rivi]MYM68129.1 TonB-dependent receptor [Duganella rivi]
MKLRMKSMPLAIFQIVASGALSMAVAHPAFAQETQAAPQRVVITGSLISRADKEGTSPVQILTAEDLVRTGSTSIAEVLSNLSANGQGALGSGFSGAFANGGAGVSLRGLTVGLTLVLIDGKRMAPYPLSDDAQRQFVDVSNIPFDAVDHIEVLKDGASSIYGSDAIAGVVNIILKKSFKGTALRADAGSSQHGGGTMYKTAITHGFGDLEADGYNLFGSLELRHSEAIKVADRDNYLWAQGDWSARGGINLNRGVPNASNNYLVATSSPFFYTPKGADPVHNPANYQFLDTNCNYAKYMSGGCAIRDTVSFLQPETKNVNALVGFTKKLNEDWQLSVKGSVFQRESENNRGVPPVFSPTSFAGNTSLVPGQNPQIVNVYGPTTFKQGVAGNTLGDGARLYGYIPGVDPANTQKNKATSSRLVANLDGSWNDWELKAAAGFTRVKTDIDYSGYVDRVALYKAFNRATNPFNPLGGNSAADMAAIAPRFSNEATSTLTFADASASHELMQLPGGPMGLAVGVSYMKKKMESPSAALLANGIVGNGAAYVLGEEKNAAAFAQVLAPVLKNLELEASARFDHYDTYGRSFTPKAGFKWKPADIIGLRGTFSKGFRAPNAAENGTAGSFFTFHSVNDPILCADGNPKTKGNVPTACAMSPAFVQLTTKDLAPEKSKSYTFGAIIEPTRYFSSTVDYYRIEVKNQINTASGVPGFVPSYVRNAVFPVDIADGNGGVVQGLPSVGTIAYATSGYVNSGGTTTSGVEFNFKLTGKTADYGNFLADLNFNHMISYVLSSNGVDYELAGTHGPSVISGDTGNPKNRAQLKLGWEKGPLTATTTFNWVGSFSALDPSVEVTDCTKITSISSRTYFFGKDVPLNYCHIPSFMSTDLNLSYKYSKNLTFKASVQNLFDRQPPIDVATYGNANNLTSYNASLHQAGAVGRFFAVGASYQF